MANECSRTRFGTFVQANTFFMSDRRPDIIHTHDLTKSYKDFVAVDHLNLTVIAGEIFGFLGHNGAGKTTAVSLLTTLIKPTSGTATICGYDITTDSLKVRASIGYLPENVMFYDNLSANENLLFFAQLSGVTEAKEKIQVTLKFLDMADVGDQQMHTFSKGMRQRIGIAQAILHDPKVLFLDEPTSGLDPMGIRHLRSTLQRLNQEKGMTIFMNTHLLSEVAKTCTTIGVLSHGRLIYHDSLRNTLNRFHDEASLEDIYLNVEEHDQAVIV